VASVKNTHHERTSGKFSRHNVKILTPVQNVERTRLFGRAVASARFWIVAFTGALTCEVDRYAAYTTHAAEDKVGRKEFITACPENLVL